MLHFFNNVNLKKEFGFLQVVPPSRHISLQIFVLALLFEIESISNIILGKSVESVKGDLRFGDCLGLLTCLVKDWLTAPPVRNLHNLRKLHGTNIFFDAMSNYWPSIGLVFLSTALNCSTIASQHLVVAMWH